MQPDQLRGPVRGCEISRIDCQVYRGNISLDGHPIRYAFDSLADELLPISRADLIPRDENKVRRQLCLIKGAKTGNLRFFSGRQLAWHRLEDLRNLVIQRGGACEGTRMLFLFWQLNFLHLSGATHSSRMHHEAAALAKELDPQWHYRRSELSSLESKARAYEAGEKVEFNGKQYSPLYTPRNDTLINTFQITTDEQKSLQTIIGKNMALERRHERDRKRDEERRRVAGAQTRDAFLKNAENKRVQAQALRDKGLSVREIAKSMGVSVGSVSLYLDPKRL